MKKCEVMLRAVTLPYLSMGYLKVMMKHLLKLVMSYYLRDLYDLFQVRNYKSRIW